MIAIQNFRRLHLKVKIHSSCWNITQKEYDGQNRPFLRRSITDLLATRSDQNTSLKISFVVSYRDDYLQEMKRLHNDGTDLLDPSMRFEFRNLPVAIGTGRNGNHVEDEYEVAWLRAGLVELIRKMRVDLEAQAPFVKFETNMDVRGHNALVAWVDSRNTCIKDQKRGIIGIFLLESPNSRWSFRKVSVEKMIEIGVGDFN